MQEARKKPEIVLGDVRRAHSIALALVTSDQLNAKKKGSKTPTTVGPAEQQKYHLVGYHASGALHSAPLIVDIMMNSILSSITSIGRRPYRLQFVNDPFPDRIVRWTQLIAI